MSLRPALILIILLSMAGDFGMLAQTTTPPGELPKDATALLSLIQAKNGLDSPDVKPWHIRAHYTIYGTDGKPKDSGIYEEWWASPHLYKRSFSSSHFSQTDYATSKGLYREGSQDWPIAEFAMHADLISPVPKIQAGDFVLKEEPESIGKSKLTCLYLTDSLRVSPKSIVNSFPGYCVENSSPVLRLGSTGTPFLTIYDQIGEFQGRYLAREIHATASNRKVYDLSVDSLATIDRVTDSFFDPPAHAKPVDLTSISFAADQEQILRRVNPIVPKVAGVRQIQGAVQLKATVEKDGHVGNITLISGSVFLAEAAKNAVSQWIFRPFFVMGEPRQFEMEILVNFQLHE
jgi:hypothetical protein